MTSAIRLLFTVSYRRPTDRHVHYWGEGAWGWTIEKRKAAKLTLEQARFIIDRNPELKCRMTTVKAVAS